ncbi:MAG: VanZ family protein [Lachnospiraceae bacterium]|nr:VanZ family protein [Lachnospiraceae bacterium]
MWESLIIENFILISIITAILFIGYCVVRKKRDVNAKELTKYEKFEVFIRCMFIGYLLAVMNITLLRTDGIRSRFAINLKPFRGIEDILEHYTYSQYAGIQIDFFIGNVLLFVPFGFLIPIVYKKINSYFKVSLLTITSILVIEIIQFFTGYGAFDIDDIMYNFVGSMCGYGFYIIIRSIHIEKNNRIKNIIIGCVPYLIILCLGIGIKVAYNVSKYGILPSQYIYKSGKKIENINYNIELNDEEKEDYVYLEAEPGGLESVTKLFGENIDKVLFGLVGKEYTTTEEDTKECRYFVSRDKTYTLKYGQFGFYEGISFTNNELNKLYENEEDTETYFSPVDKSVIRRNIDVLKDVLSKVGFEITDDVKYIVTETYPGIELRIDNGINSKGEKEFININGKFNNNGDWLKIGVYIDTYRKTKNRIDIISEKELINRIKNGESQVFIDNSETIQSIDLKWEQSSKGYYFPIYVISTTEPEENNDGVIWKYHYCQAWEFK